MGGGRARWCFGGDFNLRPRRQPEPFARLRERFGLAPPTDPAAIDHLLVRGAEVVEAPRRLPPEERELIEPDGRRLRLADHAPVSRSLWFREIVLAVAERRRTQKSGRSAGIEAKTVAELREALREMVMLTRERIEEVLGDAVERGQITARDAQGLGSSLLQRGRRETNDVLKGPRAAPRAGGREEITRATGASKGFPISGYDDLTAARCAPAWAG